MKHLAATLLLAILLWAENLPNTGLEQNIYGYYGEGVRLGGIRIVGEWDGLGYGPVTFDSDGHLVFYGNQSTSQYGVSEDGTYLKTSEIDYEFIRIGNNGCISGFMIFSEIGQQISSIACKTTYDSKTYGTWSNRVTIETGSSFSATATPDTGGPY